MPLDEDQFDRLMAALDAAEAEPAGPQDPYRAEAERYGGAMQPGGVVADFLGGAGEFVGRRLHRFGFPAIVAPETTAAGVGRAAPLTAASLALPGTGLAGIAAQGLLAAGAEAADPQSTPGSIVGQGALAGAFTGIGDVAGRAVSGMAARVRSAIETASRKAGQSIVRTQSETLRTMAETLGGLGAFNRAQQRIITRAGVEAIGETGDVLSREVRSTAARRIGAAMDAALPTGPVNVTDALDILDNIPSDVLPGKARIVSLVGKAARVPRAYQDAMRALRDASRNVARSPNAAFASEVNLAMNFLGEAGEQAGAASTKVAREQWKNLVTLEAIPAVRRTGQLPALSTESALFRSYGSGVSRGTRGNLEPATQHFLNVIDDAAEELAQRFRSSGTAERRFQTEVAQDVAGLLTGSTSPSALARSLGTATLAGPILGTAALGKAQPLAGQAGAALGRETERRMRER